MNIKKPALLLVFSLLASCPIFAQEQAQAQAPAPAQTPAGGTGSVYGRILDGTTQDYMRSAIVSIEGTNRTVTSEQGGFYVLNDVPAGEVTVVVQYAGYVTQRQTVTVTARGRVSVDFTLNLTPSAQPATTGATGEKVVQMEAFHVTSDRVGNARAFMEQKASMTMSTVMATDSFGTVQNSNAAEFLRNLPGLTIGEDSDTGEANTVSIGGMDPQYTAVNMDGARMASGAKGSFGTDANGDDSRAFQFDQVSIDNVESIEVHRMISPDMEGDSPGGTIDMVSKSAFDVKGSRLTYNVYLMGNSFNMNLNKSPGADDGTSLKIQPGASLSYTTSFNKNTMGIVVNAGYQQDFRENNRADIAIQASSWGAGNPYPSSVTYRNGQTQSTRATGNIRFDWRISPFSNISLGIGYDYRNATQFNRNVTFQSGSPATKGMNTDTSTLTYWQSDEDQSATDVVTQQSAYYQTSHTDKFNAIFNWKRYRFQFRAVAAFSYAVGATNPTDGKWFSQVNMRSKASGNSSTILWGQRPNARNMDWSFYRGDSTSLTVTGSLQQQMGNIGQYYQTSATALQSGYETTSTQQLPSLKADLRWDAPTSFPLWFKTGIEGRQDKRDAWQPTISGGSALVNHFQYIGTNEINGIGQVGNSSQNYDMGGSANDTTTPGLYSLSSPYFQSPYRFDPHMGGNVASLNIPMVNQTLLYQTYLQHPDWFYESLSDRANSRIAGYTAPVNLQEADAAWYAMGTFNPMRRLTISGGYRYEYTDQTALTLVPLTASQTANMLGTGGNPAYTVTDLYVDTMYKKGARTKTEKTYSFWLPSVSARYNFTPNFDAMLGYSENFGRLSLNSIAGNWKVNDSMQTATAPNPNLTPQHYKTFAFQTAYYFEPAGSLTFNYSIRKYTGIDYNAVPIDTSNPNSPDVQNLINTWGQATLDTFTQNGYTIYTYMPTSANDRAMQTLELSYNQAIPGIPGLRLGASFTRIVPNWRTYGSNVSAKPKQGSVWFTYSYRNFNARVTGNWTDRYWVYYNSDNLYSNQGAYARFTAQIELTYRFSKNFSVYLVGTNVTNEDNSQWTGNPGVITREINTGAIWRIGVKGEF